MSSIIQKKGFLFCLALSLVLLFSNNTSAQMRQVYVDNIADNEIYKLSFYSPSVGYVAFRDWIGYTTDSGRTFTKKYITMGNVNYNGYSVNLTFGFGISGVKAFDQNNIIAYGDYGLVPSILYSSNGGNSYTLIFHSQYNPLQLSTGIQDMVFPQNNSIGFATDADRILKTTNQGLSWSPIRLEPGSFYDKLEAVDNNTVFALSTAYTTNKLIKTSNGGTNWQTVNVPALSNGKITYVHFLTAAIGWLSMYDGNSNYYFYKTVDGGSNWILQNNIEATPFNCYKMKFIDANTGYALSGQNTVYKTFNSGAIWEPLPRDNNYTYLGYSHNDLQCLNVTQLWAGGGHGFLELSTNGGGTPIPKAFFRIDTAGLSTTNTVNLLNYSRTSYTNQWFLNGVQISTAYNSSYIHNVARLRDTIKLVVSNGTTTDTLIRYQDFFQAVVISSFTPNIGATGTVVTINGSNFSGVTSVSFGGVPASNFTIVSPIKITATVGTGATGNVVVGGFDGYAALGTFTYFAPPAINLPTSISDNILCKAESITVTIQNSQANVRYDLIDSLNNSYGFVNSNGGTVAFYTTLISRSGNYKIKATRLNVSSTATFTNNILILVEHTKSAFTASRVNIIPGETINFYNHSQETQSFNWLFGQDASTSTSTSPNPQNIFYTLPGQKTLSLISISANGCRDTLSANAVFVIPKPSPDLTCYIQNVDDSDYNYFPESPASMNRVLLAGDNGYYIGGFGNKAKLKTNIGTQKNFLSNGTAYFAKYTTDGILSWFTSITSNGKFNAAAKDSLGNVYIVGYCRVINYLTLPNGDSLKISATPIDTDPQSSKINGFILKLDSSGNYLWHTVIYDPSTHNIGGIPLNITIEKGQVAVAGNFNYNLAYFRNGVGQNLLTLPNSSNYMNNFVFRINLDGSFVWYAYFENTSNNYKWGISGTGIDNAKNYYVTGYYEDKVVIHDAGNVNTVTYVGSVGAFSSYVLKFDSTGRLIWKINIRNNFANKRVYANDLATTPNGDIYITGLSSLSNSSQYFQITNANNSTTNVSLASYFLLKFDSSGMYKWGVGSRYSYYGQGYSVYVKGANIYTTGSVYENNNTTPFLYTMTSTDNADVVRSFYNSEFFIANYDTSGVLKGIFNSGQNPGGHVVPNELTIDTHQNFIISGLIDKYNGGTGSYTCFNSTVSINGNDCFFTKLNPTFCNSAVPPVANAGTDRTICASDTTTIGTTAINGYSYSWVSNPPGFTSNIAMPLVNPATTTSYYLTVINLGYIARDTVIITTAASPVANAGPDQTICSGSPTTIGTPAIGGNTYSWTSNPAGFTSNSAQPVITPAVNTQYFLVVINTGGCIKKDTVSITIGSTLTPAVTITASSTNICFGTSITFTATPTNGGITPAYQWQVNGTNAGTNSSTFTTNTLTGISDVTVIITSSLSCASPTSATSNTITVTVNPSVTPSVNVVASSTNICAGASVTFTATPTNGGSTPTYQWQVNGVNAGSNSSTFTTATLSNGDNVKVNMISNASCATPTSASSNIISVTVNPSVTPSVSVVASATNTCAGTSITFTATPTNGGSTPNYQWQVNGVNAGTNSSTFTSNTLSNGNNVKVIMASNASCALPASATSNSISITVNPLIIPTVNIIASATTICTSTSVTFTATPINGGSAPTYQWQVNGVNAGTNSSIFTTSALNNGDNVKVMMTSNASCASPASATSNSILITVSTLVTPTVNVVTSSTTICAGSSVTFTATPTNGGSTPTYQWKVNGINAGTNSSTFSTTSLTNGSVVNVVLISSLSCASPTTATSNNIIITISSVTPSVSITTAANNICQGANTTFTAIAANGGSNPLFQWKKNGINVGTNTSTFSSTNLANGDIISVVLTSNAICANPANVSSNSILMTVNPLTTPSVTISGVTNVTQGSSVVISSVISNAGNSPAYQWQDSTASHSWLNINNATASSINYLPLLTGDKLRCFVTGTNSCASNNNATSNLLTFTVTPSIVSPIFYPNPVTNFLIVDGLQYRDSWESVHVIDMAGARVAVVPDLTGLTRVKVDVSTLPPGIYMCVLSSRFGYARYYKFVKL